MANEYRLNSNGEITNKAALIAANKNMSMPKVWNANTLESLGVSPVFETPKPSPSAAYKRVQRNGVVQDAKDNWVQAWAEVDMFAATTDEDDVTTTKAKHEEAYQEKLDAAAAAVARETRNRLLAPTDFYALSDVTMSDDMETYRAALRAVPAQDGFPNTITWPKAP
jgi:hypothetical protein